MLFSDNERVKRYRQSLFQFCHLFLVVSSRYSIRVFGYHVIHVVLPIFRFSINTLSILFVRYDPRIMHL
jgi:hypothetical protein